MTQTESARVEPDLSDALASLGIAPAVSGFVRVEGGLDNQMWRFATADGHQHVLRVYRAGRELALRRERAAIETAAAAGLPVPVFEAAGVWHDRPAAVLPWMPGVPLLRAVRELAGLERLGHRFGATQAAIHRVPAPPALDSTPPASWVDACGSEHAAVAAALRAHGVTTGTLVHFDYHPLNVLAEGDTVTAVLDWVNAAAGDPRADLARTATILSTAPAPGGPPDPRDDRPRRLLYEAWWRGYTIAAGPVDIPPAFMAWAGAWLLRDLEGHAGEAGTWLTGASLEPLRGWVRSWSIRAGIEAN